MLYLLLNSDKQATYNYVGRKATARVLVTHLRPSTKINPTSRLICFQPQYKPGNFEQPTREETRRETPTAPATEGICSDRTGTGDEMATVATATNVKCKHSSLIPKKQIKTVFICERLIQIKMELD